MSGADPQASVRYERNRPPGCRLARRQRQQLVADASERAAAAGIEAETHVRTGDAAHALIEVAEGQGADLIIVGNKGLSSPARFLLGSVPSKVVHHAPCHVLVVRTT
jgi:nucleotide-binding universal stress UspA family protein